MTSRKLGDIAAFIRGITFKPNDVVPPETPGTVRCMRTKNVQQKIDLMDVWTVDARFVRREEQYLRYGDILVSSANSWNLVGKCSWVPRLKWRSTFGGFIAVLRADPSKVLPRYLYHWFSATQTQAVVRGLGRQTTNISNLDFARCLALAVPLPTIEAQQRIVDRLDVVGEMRDVRSRSIAFIDELIDSIFFDMFGDCAGDAQNWREECLGNLGVIQGGLQVSASSRQELPVTVPYLRVANVYRNKVELTEVKYMQVSERELQRTRLSRGDLLIVEGHGNATEIGRVATWTAAIDPCVHQNHLIRVRLDSTRLLPDYACFCLNSLRGRRHLLRAAKTTSGLNTINVSNVKSVPITLAPMDIQRVFSERLTELRSDQALRAVQLKEVEALLTSLQQDAFGEKL